MNKIIKTNRTLTVALVGSVILAAGTSLRAADADGTTTNTPPPAMAAADRQDPGQTPNSDPYYRGNDCLLYTSPSPRD